MISIPDFRSHPSRLSFTVRILLVFVTVLYGLVGYADILFTSHDSGNESVHDRVSILAEPSGGHDHHHDEPEPDGSHFVHHGAADYSHDTPNLLSGDESTFVNSKDVWHRAPHVQAYPALYFSFERPSETVRRSDVDDSYALLAA